MFVLDEDDTIARMGKNHLEFSLGAGKLTAEQTSAASEAVAASLETQAAILADLDVVAITAGDTVAGQVDTEGEDDLMGETP